MTNGTTPVQSSPAPSTAHNYGGATPSVQNIGGGRSGNNITTINTNIILHNSSMIVQTEFL